MGIGAIGATSSAGMVGVVGYQPYVYNTNQVSSASLNKVNRISDDALSGKTDFSGLLEGENTNPLKPGQSADFDAIIAMQMQLSQNNQQLLMNSTIQ